MTDLRRVKAESPRDAVGRSAESDTAQEAAELGSVTFGGTRVDADTGVGHREEGRELGASTECDARAKLAKSLSQDSYGQNPIILEFEDI